ncbi:MAG: hypothetical protein QOH42_1083 [Blastocatellia bacterium]|nr:hypothetical protein [Blastocatellia bacterium]
MYHGTPEGSALFPLANNGYRGVNIFFGISGFLICSKLLSEKSLKRKISLKNFYTRRVFRILPPAFFYVAVIALLGAVGVLARMPRSEWLSSLFFFRNYLSPQLLSSYTGHFWSLSVEEHFYLIFPALLILAGRRARFIIPALALGFGIWRTLDMHYNLLNIQTIAPTQRTDRCADALLWACALAIWIRDERVKGFLERRLTFTVWLLLAGIYIFTWYHAPAMNGTIEGILVPVLILGTVLNPRNPLSRLFELRGLVWIGRVSYSLYLWQTILFAGRYYEPNVLQTFPLNAVVLLACACLSYYLLEKPMIAWGHRLSRPRERRESLIPLAPPVRERFSQSITPRSERSQVRSQPRVTKNQEQRPEIGNQRSETGD